MKTLQLLIQLFCLFFWFGVKGGLCQEFQVAEKHSWIRPVASAPVAGKVNDGAKEGVDYLLVDCQYNLVLATAERYCHYLDNAYTPAGVEEISKITINFDPNYETLVVHEILLHRDGEVADRLGRTTFNTIQREQNIEYSIYDGSKTLTAFIEDVRVGDSIEYSYTITGANPVFSGHFTSFFTLGWQVPVRSIYYRLLWPEDRQLNLKQHRTTISPVQSTKDSVTEYIWQVTDAEVVSVDSNMPDWFDPYPSFSVSDFASWKEVVQWALPLYQVEDDGEEDMLPIVNRIREQAEDNKEEQILLALQFVQEDIRYLGIEMGARSHKPSSPAEVIHRRFGDCKDKSRLLVALLKELDIFACPVLVNTDNGKILNQQVPSPELFNHVITMVSFKGERYWLDPTRNNQRGQLGNLYQPDYHYGLVIADGSKELEDISSDINQVHRKVVEEEFVFGESPNDAATYKVDGKYYGYYADSNRGQIARQGLEKMGRSFLEYTASYYPDVQQGAKLKVSDDQEGNVLLIEEEYSIPNMWEKSDDGKHIKVHFQPFLILDYVKFVGSPLRQTPLVVTHPVQFKQVTRIKGVKNLTVEPLTKMVTDKAFQYSSSVKKEGSEVVLEYSYVSLADHVLPEDIRTYSDNIEKVRDDAYFQIQMRAPSLPPVEPAAFRVNWVVIVPIILAGILMLFVGYWLVSAYDHAPRHSGSVNGTLEGLGGWLVFPCLGLFAAPVNVLFQVKGYLDIFQAEQWSLVLEELGYAMGALLVAEMIYFSGVVIFAATLLVLFFKKRRTFPSLFITYLLANLAFVFVDNGALYMLGGLNQEELNDVYGDVGRQLIYVLIWVAYMVRSERVKATFRQPVAIREARP